MLPLLGDFDSAMIHTLREMKNIQDTPVIEVWHNDSDQVLAYRRKNNIFVFNFNPTRSFTDYGFWFLTEHTRLFSIPMQKNLEVLAWQTIAYDI